MDKKLTIIYSPKYNVSLSGMETQHPFDLAKAKKIYAYLHDLPKRGHIIYKEPQPVDDSELLKVHSRAYLDSLKNPVVIAAIAEFPALARIAAQVLDEALLLPMRYAVGGTLLGVQSAWDNGWAVNLSGGFHHAKSDSGGGFCYYGDIPLAILKVWEKNPQARVLIIDLDAHQGNGHESICGPDKRVFILDVYNADIYPDDKAAKKYIDFDYPIHSRTSDKKYLELVSRAVTAAVSQVQPDFIIYNAGTDIYQKDLLGDLAVSQAGIIARDALVFEAAQGIPLLMLLSGGYSPASWKIIAKSLENIINKFL